VSVTLEIILIVISLLFGYFAIGFLINNLIFNERNIWNNLPFIFIFSYLYLGFLIYILGLFKIAFILNIIILQITTIFALIALNLYFQRPFKQKFKFPIYNKWVILTLIIFIALIFYQALLFPSTQADAVSYHLVIPEIIKDTGQLPNLENSANLREVTSSMTGLSQTFNSYFYMLGIPYMARFLSPFTFFMFILLLMLYADKFFNQEIKNWLVLLIFTAPIINALAINEYIEMQFLFVASFVLYCFLVYEKERNLKYLSLALIFAGFCSLIKITGFLILLILFLFIITDYNYGQKNKKYLSILTIFSLIAIVISQIIFFRNLNLFNCATYPFKCDSILNQIFSSAPIILGLILMGFIIFWILMIELFKFRIKTKYLIILGISSAIISLILNKLFWTKYLFFYFFIPFLPSELNTGGGYGLIITIVGFISIFYFIRKKDKRIDYILTYGLLIWGFLSLTANDYSIVRYVIPIFLIGIILSAILLNETKEKTRKIILFIILILLIFNLLMVCFSYKSYINPPSYTILNPFNSDQEDLEHYKPYLINGINYINTEIPEEKILVYGGSIYFIENIDRVYTYDSLIIQDIFENSKNEEEVVKKLKEIGIKYIIVEGEFIRDQLEFKSKWDQNIAFENYFGIDSNSNSLVLLYRYYDEREYSNPEFKDYTEILEII